MKAILKSFSDHGTFVQPDALEYILSKEHPPTFAQFILDNLKEYPLILTLEQIKTLERTDEPEDLPPQPKTVLETKELQTKVLSTLYNNRTTTLLPPEEIDAEYDDPDKDDQIDLPSEEEQPVVKASPVSRPKPGSTPEKRLTE